MSGVRVRDNHIKYNGIKYFRGRATHVELLDYGRKRSPLTSANYIDVYRQLPSTGVKVEAVREVKIDFDQTRYSDIDTSISGLEVIGASGGNIAKRLHNGHLSLLHVAINRSEIEDAVNKNNRALDYLIDEGDDGRAVCEVFVVVDANIAEKFNSATKYDLGVSKGDIKVSIAGTFNTEVSNELHIGEGSTFAYALLKFKWDHNKKKKRTRVTGSQLDQWGLS